MKLTVGNTPKIEGYQNIELLYGKWRIEGLPKNSQSHILAIDAVDHVEYNDREKLLTELSDLLRKDCEIVVGGIDVREVIRQVYLRQLTVEQFNNVVHQVKSFGSLRETVEIIKSLGLTVKTSKFEGARYEVTAGR